MALVVFLRGVNVGGHKKFKPSELVGALADLDLENIGAAGTFVVRGSANAKDVRERIARSLPFEAEMMVCPAREIVELVRSEPFGRLAAGVKPFVSVLSEPLRTRPRLPLERPAGKPWEVRVIKVTGRYVLSLCRPGRAGVYPNEVVERDLGATATTRAWSTIVTICSRLL